MNESLVRAILARLAAPDGQPLLAAEDVERVAVEGDWVGVVLRDRRGAAELIRRVHAGLAAALPGARVEVHAGYRIFRGGAGFGAGRYVVAVLGGKGGVGKSTVSVNLALTLAAMGHAVGLVDGDVNAPDIPHMVGIHPQAPPSAFGWRIDAAGITPPSRWRRPERRLGIEVTSVGFIVPERLPLLVGGRVMVSALLRHLLFEVDWTADVLIIDAPPGTGAELQVIAGELPLSGAVFVTTPQDLAQMDAERTLMLLQQHGVPVIGVVQNMAALACPHCGQPVDLFSHSSRLVDAGVPVLGRIPFDVQLSVTADQGRPLVLGDPRGPIAYEFARIAASVRRWLADQDAAAAAD